MTDALIAIIALACGAGLMWLRVGKAREALAVSQSRVAFLEQQAVQDSLATSALRSELADARRIAASESGLRAAVQARSEEQIKSSDEKLRLLTEAKASWSDAFKALSAEALKTNNDSFLQLATTSLRTFQEKAQGDLDARGKAVESLVQPIRDSLLKVDGKLGEIEKSRESAYSALNEQLRGLVETHLPMLRNETSGLVKALRQPTVRGRWGEIQLQRVVEMAGMLEHCDFTQQESTDDGRQRPDIVVRLPGGKQIVVDAKAPVSAYLEAAEANDDDVRKVHLARHAQQVRTHITALGRKSYWEAFDPSPDLVILFLPGEMFYSAALQEDPQLIEFAVNEKVLLATPTTLIALLRTIAFGWRQEALAVNAREVAQLGRQLYERIATLAGHWNDVGDKLGKAVKAYNSAGRSIEARLLVPARKFSELQVAQGDDELAAAEMIEILPQPVNAPEFDVAALPANHAADAA